MINLSVIQRKLTGWPKTASENEQSVYKYANNRRENPNGHQINKKIFKFTIKSWKYKLK